MCNFASGNAKPILSFLKDKDNRSAFFNGRQTGTNHCKDKRINNKKKS